MTIGSQIHNQFVWAASTTVPPEAHIGFTTPPFWPQAQLDTLRGAEERTRVRRSTLGYAGREAELGGRAAGRAAGRPGGKRSGRLSMTNVKIHQHVNEISEGTRSQTVPVPQG